MESDLAEFFTIKRFVPLCVKYWFYFIFCSLLKFTQYRSDAKAIFFPTLQILNHKLQSDFLIKEKVPLKFTSKPDLGLMFSFSFIGKSPYHLQFEMFLFYIQLYNKVKNSLY